MQKKYRILLAAAAILAMAGGYFWLTHKPEKPAPVVSETVNLEDFIYVYQNDKDSLAEIVVRPKRGESTELYQKDDVWQARIDFPEEDLVKSFIRAAGATALQMIAERIIDEHPTDLSVYGLESPSIEVDFVTWDGAKTTLQIGNKNPAGNKYYVKMADSDTVYMVLAYSPKNFDFTYGDLRNKQIQFGINPEAVTYYKIVNGDKTSVIVPAANNDPQLIGQQTSQYKIIEPYAPHSVSSDKMTALKQAIPNVVTVSEFIDDHPSDYSKYGLDPPNKVFQVKDNHFKLTLNVGTKTPNGNYYVKIDDDPKVVGLSPYVIEPLFQYSAFDLHDKFILLININSSDKVRLTIDGRTYECEITRLYDDSKPNTGEEKEPDTNYFIDGLEIEEKPFKSLYQAMIGLLADSENPWETPYSDPAVIIEYSLNSGSVRNPKAAFVKVNRNFYAAFVNGKNNFLVSAYQIDNIRDTVKAALESAR